LTDISDEVYDGLIAWHPDRLARNMKEAGEIIDLLDKKEILDLQFPSFTFENTTSGKMTLGITFVLSKQYSDTLSDNVKRGNKRMILEAKSVGTAKHGYKKNKNQRLIPDGNNFVLIQNAFKMRLGGSTFDQIAEYLNDNNYTKKKIKLDRYIAFT
jgi:DNA invertase Pin-like site-specific DNA recombinase